MNLFFSFYNLLNYYMISFRIFFFFGLISSTVYSDLYFSKDFHRGYDRLLKRNNLSVYSYEFKFDGEINICKTILFYLRPTLEPLKGKNPYLFSFY